MIFGVFQRSNLPPQGPNLTFLGGQIWTLRGQIRTLGGQISTLGGQIWTLGGQIWTLGVRFGPWKAAKIIALGPCLSFVPLSGKTAA